MHLVAMICTAMHNENSYLKALVLLLVIEAMRFKYKKCVVYGIRSHLRTLCPM